MLVFASKKILFLGFVCVCLAFLFFPLTSYAVGPFVPFGGHVTFLHVCNSGFLILVAPGVPPAIPSWFMITPASFPWSYYIPPFLGQNVIGVAAPAPVPCLVGPIPIGVGFPILYWGSGLVPIV